MLQEQRHGLRMRPSAWVLGTLFIDGATEESSSMQYYNERLSIERLRVLADSVHTSQQRVHQPVPQDLLIPTACALFKRGTRFGEAQRPPGECTACGRTLDTQRNSP